MKKLRLKHTRLGTRNRTTAKGREILASLAEAVEVERAGVPVESRFNVRIVEMPDQRVAYDAHAICETRDRIE